MAIDRAEGGRPDPGSPQEGAGRKELAAKVERGLEESLAGIVASVMDAIVTIDASHRIVLFNGGAERMFGCSAGEALGIGIERFIPGWIRAGNRDSGEQRGLTGRRASGEQMPIEATISHAVIGGRLLSTIVLRDVSEQVRATREREELLARERAAREALERERARLEVLFAQLPAILALLSGPDLIVESVSPAALGALHQTIEQVRGRPARDVLPHPATLAICEQVLRTGETIRKTELRAKRDFGRGAVEERFYDATVAPVRDQMRRISGVIVFAQDVTESVVARQRVEAQQRWLEAILDLKPTPFLLIEPGTGRTLFANLAAHALVGGKWPDDWESVATKYRMSDGSGREIPIEDMPIARAARGESFVGLTYDWETSLGTRTIVCNAGMLPAMHGHPATVVMSILDATELRAAQRREIAARHEAEVANRAKDEFLATVSHELRTPLNAILGWASMLQSPRLPEEKKLRAVQTIERNARVQAQLIEDMLDISRITTGKVRLNLALVDPAHFANMAIESVRPAAVAKDVELRLIQEPGIGSLVADPDRAQQILWNLLSNAVKFTPRGGRVEVRIRRRGDQLEIAVCDTGQGIDPAFLPFVFERFRQADGTTTRAHGGLGLGLSIVRQLVELHGGTVHAESEGLGRGATFVVQLPIQRRPAGAPPLPQVGSARALATATGPVTSAPALERRRILVVDDEPDARDLVRSILEQCGAVVDVAGGTSEAFALLREHPPDLVVSDIGMPEEDGYSLIRRVRSLPVEQGGGVPAVALTAYARAEDHERALSEGFHAHVSKPVDPHVLVETLSRLLGR